MSLRRVSFLVYFSQVVFTVLVSYTNTNSISLSSLRFVELYTGQTITFGKIQKQIKCELVNAQSSSSSLRLSKNLNNALPLLASFEEDSNKDSNMDDSALASWDETDLDDSDEQQESDGENEEFSTALKVDSDYCIEMSNDSEIDSLPSEQVDRNPSAEKKLPVKVKQKHAPNKKPTSKKNVTKVLDVPGSAKRWFPVHDSWF